MEHTTPISMDVAYAIKQSYPFRFLMDVNVSLDDHPILSSMQSGDHELLELKDRYMESAEYDLAGQITRKLAFDLLKINPPLKIHNAKGFGTLNMRSELIIFTPDNFVEFLKAFEYLVKYSKNTKMIRLVSIEDERQFKALEKLNKEYED